MDLLLPIALFLGIVLGAGFIGRRRALKQLGKHEYNQRWANINKIRKW